MKIKLFESFSDLPEFEQTIGIRPQDAYMYIYNEPGDVKDLGGATGKCRWTMEIDQSKSGYELGEVKLTYLYFTADYDNEDDELVDKEYEIDKLDFNYENMKTEIEGFPLYLTSIEIDMHNTHDPEFWEIELKIGKSD